jgi:hypothetical protein
MEGKADYLVIEYGRRVLIGGKASFATVPTRGAAGMNELIGLFLGWSVPFVVCLDDDRAGRASAKQYRPDWALTENEIFTRSSVSSDLAGKSVEAMLTDADLQLISDHFGIRTSPTKSQIQLFFSEMLAKSQVINLSKEYRERVTDFDKKFSAILAGRAN